MEAVMDQGFTPAIWIHFIAAVVAMGLGAMVFLGRKGSGKHRWMGRGWAVLMLVVAISSFWIQSEGSFSWIHGLSVFTLCLLTAGVFFAATGRVRGHRYTMIGLYSGSLLIAGAFSLMPQRLLGQMLWTSVANILS
jgi:uncharacterized membrane protein